VVPPPAAHGIEVGVSVPLHVDRAGVVLLVPKPVLRPPELLQKRCPGLLVQCALDKRDAATEKTARAQDRVWIGRPRQPRASRSPHGSGTGHSGTDSHHPHCVCSPVGRLQLGTKAVALGVGLRAGLSTPAVGLGARSKRADWNGCGKHSCQQQRAYKLCHPDTADPLSAVHPCGRSRQPRCGQAEPRLAIDQTTGRCSQGPTSSPRSDTGPTGAALAVPFCLRTACHPGGDSLRVHGLVPATQYGRSELAQMKQSGSS